MTIFFVVQNAIFFETKQKGMLIFYVAADNGFLSLKILSNIFNEPLLIRNRGMNTLAVLNGATKL